MFKNFYNLILFNQIRSLVDLAKFKIIQAQDTPELPNFLKPTTIDNQPDLNYSQPKSLMASVFKVTRKSFSYAVFFGVAACVASLFSPFLVNQFIHEVQQKEVGVGKLVFLAISLGGLGMLSGLLQQFSFLHSLRSFQVANTLLNIKIYKHALRMSQNARSKYQVGDIVNLMGSDAETAADISITVNELTAALLLIVGGMASMFYYFGHSSWVALICFLLLYPITYKVSLVFEKYGDQLMSFRDQRMTILTQVIQSIRVVKYFAWEQAVKKEVEKVRNQEITTQKKIARAEVLSGVGYLAVSTVVLFGLFFVHVQRGFDLDMPLLFTAVAIFALLEDPLGHIARLISRLISIQVSSKRICDYVASEVVESKKNVLASEYIITAENLSCSINGQSILRDVSFALKSEESLAIIGPVGAGKSTLFNLLLGEYAHEGKIIWNRGDHKIALVTQESYIVNASLQDNILFGEPLDKDRLERAIYFSALKQDLEYFAGGLQTEIGEKGVNLSGGQKQRVALARAYYSQADVIFLDDPLSAVDVQTEKILVERLFLNAWIDKTLIVTTHRLEALHAFSKVLFLQNGQVEAYGALSELKKSSPAFNQFISHLKTEHGAEFSTSVAVASANGEKSVLRITEDEERSQGAVESQVYIEYIKALGGQKYMKLGIFTLFAGAILYNCLPLLQKWWLTLDYKKMDIELLNFILVFGVIGLLSLVISASNELYWVYRGLMAGKAFHERLLHSILNAKVRFFDSTPVGRILQRFSRDIESVDRHLQWSFNSAVHSFIYFVVSLFLIVVVLPVVILFLAPILIVYYSMQMKYRRAAREMKRLDSIARSPRYAHFKETLLGLPILRAYQNQNWFMKEFFEKLTFSQQMYYSHYMLNRWFSVRIPILGSTLSIATLVVVALMTYYGGMSAGLAGLVTVYSLNLWKSLNWCVRIFSDIESRMNSIERLKYYSDLPSEDYDQSWIPARSKVSIKAGLTLEFKNIQARYDKTLPLILKGITFRAEAGAKLGLIGRTGSGKSTVLQCLYRLVDIEQGEIKIDGQNINDLSLQSLRRMMAMVPQDPALFLGTVRSNIDRYNEYSDAEIFASLKRVQLDAFVLSLKDGLNEPVVENGNNFSQGQKQLLCLARALLIKAPIVVMDEATASVDLQTDSIIQRVLKEDLKGVTRITIAHRLETIMDSDLIVKIDNGMSEVILPQRVSTDESHAAGPRYVLKSNLFD